MSVTGPAWRWCWWCCLAELIVCPCQSSLIRQVNKSRQGSIKAGEKKKSHYKSTPLGSRAITFCKWSSVCSASCSHCAGALHIHCVNEAARASVWRVRGCLPLLLCGLMRWLRQRRGHDVNSRGITVERGVFPRSRAANWVWQSCFCWEAIGTPPGPAPGSECGCTFEVVMKGKAETGGRIQLTPHCKSAHS